MRGTPCVAKARSAPSRSFSEMASLRRAASTAKRCRATTGSMTASDARPLNASPVTVGKRENVTELVSLGRQVPSIGVGGRDLERHTLDHAQSVALDATDLLRIVGEDPEVL